MSAVATGGRVRKGERCEDVAMYKEFGSYRRPER